MKEVYELRHRYVVEMIDGEKVHETKLLGFFSNEEKCQESINYYITQEGFKNYPNSFVIDRVEADVDDYHDIPGEFNETVYFLSHEWYDGQYDYVTYIGYYSTQQKAQEALALIASEEEFVEHPDGFVIDAYEIDEMEWMEGFCSLEDMELVQEV